MEKFSFRDSNRSLRVDALRMQNTRADIARFLSFYHYLNRKRVPP